MISSNCSNWVELVLVYVEDTAWLLLLLWLTVRATCRREEASRSGQPDYSWGRQWRTIGQLHGCHPEEEEEEAVGHRIRSRVAAPTSLKFRGDSSGCPHHGNFTLMQLLPTCIMNNDRRPYILWVKNTE